MPVSSAVQAPGTTLTPNNHLLCADEADFFLLSPR